MCEDVFWVGNYLRRAQLGEGTCFRIYRAHPLTNLKIGQVMSNIIPGDLYGSSVWEFQINATREVLSKKPHHLDGMRLR